MSRFQGEILEPNNVTLRQSEPTYSASACSPESISVEFSAKPKPPACYCFRPTLRAKRLLVFLSSCLDVIGLLFLALRVPFRTGQLL